MLFLTPNKIIEKSLMTKKKATSGAITKTNNNLQLVGVLLLYFTSAPRLMRGPFLWPTVITLGTWWPHQNLNLGHPDYESSDISQSHINPLKTPKPSLRQPPSQSH